MLHETTRLIVRVPYGERGRTSRPTSGQAQFSAPTRVQRLVLLRRALLLVRYRLAESATVPVLLNRQGRVGLGTTNSKAVGEWIKPTASPSSPHVPLSWAALAGLSNGRLNLLFCEGEGPIRLKKNSSSAVTLKLRSVDNSHNQFAAGRGSSVNARLRVATNQGENHG
jgi:hypothetical protein